MVGDIPFTLTIQGVGDIAVGGIVASTNILDNVDTTTPESSFGVEVGDLAALSAGNELMSTNAGNTFDVLGGNLRNIDAGTIGIGATVDPEINVPDGSVGLVTTTTGSLYFNFTAGFPPAIGGDFQVVSSAGDFGAKLVAKGNIGVLRAANMTIGPSIFQVNSSNSTTPGYIDLIDVTGDVGTLQGGGPRIITGPGGNVGYFRVGGTVYRDADFGGSQPEATLYQPGETVTLTDDSGASVVVTPTETPSSPGVVGTSGPDPTGQVVNPALPQLTVTAYGIEGSGGVAIISIISTGGVTLTGSGNENGQTVQIGEINAQGLGQVIKQLVNPPNKNPQPAQPVSPTGAGGTTGGTTTPTFYQGPDTAGVVGRTLPLPNPPILDPFSTTPLDVILTGSARMDAYEVDGGFFSTITNSTGGDIVNVRAQSVGTLSTGGQIGMTQGHTGAAVIGLVAAANTFPLIDVRNAVIAQTVLPAGLVAGGAGPDSTTVNTVTTPSGASTGAVTPAVAPRNSGSPIFLPARDSEI